LPKKLIPLSENNLQRNENYLHYTKYSQNKKLNKKSLRVQNQNTTNFKIKQVTKTSGIKVIDQIIRCNQLPNAINYAVNRLNGNFWNAS